MMKRVTVWVLEKDGRFVRCEIVDQTDRDAGYDVQIIDVDGWPTFSQRCPTQSAAEFLAASCRRDRLRDGFRE